jgi:hypothetical protein
VLSGKEPEHAELLLYNALGQKVLQYRLMQTVESIPLPGLKNGIYFLLIQKNGKKDFTGKVIVR